MKYPNITKRVSYLLIYVFLGVLLLYLLSAFPMGIIISHESPQGVPYLHILARFTRILLAGILCWGIRRQFLEVLLNMKVRRKKAELIILGCGLVTFFLNLTHVTDKFFHSLAYAVGIFPPEKSGFWIALLWEQVISIDFLWSILLGYAILLFPISPKHGHKSI